MQDLHGLEIIRPETLVARLEKHPHLQARIGALLDVVENSTGDAVKADEAEQRVAEELRQMGHEALQAWAERKQARVEAESERRADLTRKEKRIYWYTRFGQIGVAEQIYRRASDGRQIRPFAASAGVVCRGYSHGLQRAMTDFGAMNRSTMRSRSCGNIMGSKCPKRRCEWSLRSTPRRCQKRTT